MTVEQEILFARVRCEIAGETYNVWWLFSYKKAWDPLPPGFRLIAGDVEQLERLCRKYNVKFIRRRTAEASKREHHYVIKLDGADYRGVIVTLPDYLELKAVAMDYMRQNELFLGAGMIEIPKIYGNLLEDEQ